MKYCLGTSSGKDENHLALWSLDVEHGDEIIIPANTFIATARGATLGGATPVFVDCHKQSYNIDPEKVEKAIKKKQRLSLPFIFTASLLMWMLQDKLQKYIQFIFS